MNKYISFLLISMMINPTALHAAGRIQDSDVKSLTDVGGTVNVSRLINASKIYDSTNNQQLSLSIANGALGGGSGGAVGTYSNFLNTKNPDAEKGTTLNWTNTGGALSVINTGQADGVYSFQFVASATAQKATSFLGLIPALSYSKNGLVRFTYSTTNSDFILQVTDGTNVLGQVILPAASTYQYGLVTLVLPSSGSIQVNIVSQSAGTINFDDLYVGENFQAGITSTTATPTIQKFLSGSGTYTPTSSAVSYIIVKMIGGGGGGGGSACTSGGAGTGGTGGNTTFGSSLLTANGGGGGGSVTIAGAGGGGVAIISAPALPIIQATGAPGLLGAYSNTGSVSLQSGSGASTLFGAGGAGITGATASGIPASINSGGGGGGGSCAQVVYQSVGHGGGAGGYLEALINSPASTYSYSIGAAGTGGTAGAGGGSGGAAATGFIVITEFYTPSTNQLYLASSGGLNPGDRVEGFYTSCPVGTIKADGSAISRTTYASLFAAISTTYGTGDGTTTFNLPNAQGVFTRGAGSQTIGGIAYTGAQGTTQGDQMQGHNHLANGALMVSNQVSSAAGTGFTAGTLYSKVGSLADSSPTNTGSAVGSPISDGTNGAPRTGAETRPANITDLVCIRTLPASPAPVVTNSVTTAGNTERVERATIVPTSAAACSVTSQSGTWINSTTPNAPGDCTLNFTLFSAAPTCAVTQTNGGATSSYSVNIQTSSATQLRVQETYTSGGGTSVNANTAPLHIICMGPR